MLRKYVAVALTLLMVGQILNHPVLVDLINELSGVLDLAGIVLAIMWPSTNR